MEEEMSLKPDSKYRNSELDKLDLVEARTRIKKLESEVALSRKQIDHSEKEKHHLIEEIKKLHNKFILTRLDSLIGQLHSNVSLLNDIIETMKRTDNGSASLHSDDSKEIFDEHKENPVINKTTKENYGLTSVTQDLTFHDSKYTSTQKLSESYTHISDDDDPIVINEMKYHEVLILSDDDDSDRSNFQRVLHSNVPTIIEFDDSPVQSINEDCYLLSDDSNEALSAFEK